MNEELLNELLQSNQANFQKVFALLDTLISGLSNLEARVATLEAKDAITRPLWQEIRADQQRIVERLGNIEAHLLRQDERIDRIEAHLQQQDDKMEDGFRKLNDKFEIMSEEWFETRADLKHLKRRVTQLESITQ